MKHTLNEKPRSFSPLPGIELHDMGEIAMEFSRRNQTRRAFQRDLSETKRRR